MRGQKLQGRKAVKTRDDRSREKVREGREPRLKKARDENLQAPVTESQESDTLGPRVLTLATVKAEGLNRSRAHTSRHHLLLLAAATHCCWMPRIIITTKCQGL
jgi:hypothetical protein